MWHLHTTMLRVYYKLHTYGWSWNKVKAVYSSASLNNMQCLLLLKKGKCILLLHLALCQGRVQGPPFFPTTHRQETNNFFSAQDTCVNVSTACLRHREIYCNCACTLLSCKPQTDPITYQTGYWIFLTKYQHAILMWKAASISKTLWHHNLQL